MKTRLFTLLLVVTAAFMAQSQSLTKKAWFADISSDEMKLGLILGFDDAGECAFQLLYDEQEVEGEMKILISAALGATGTYTLKDKTLAMKLDLSNAECGVDLDIEGVDESSKNLMKNLLKGEIEKNKESLKKELIESLPLKDSYTVKELTETTLVLDNITFVALPDE